MTTGTQTSDDDAATGAAAARAAVGGRVRSSVPLLDVMLDAVLELDAEGVVRYANPAAAQLFGRSVQQLVGVPLGIPLSGPPDGALEVLDLTRPDGRQRRAEYRAVPDPDRSGGTVLTFRDVTERDRLREQLVQADKMDAIGRLAGGVAHDFNNLLTAMLGHVDLAETQLRRIARDGGGDAPAAAVFEPVTANLRDTRKAANAARSLTLQLLQLSSRHRPPAAGCDLAAVLRDHQRMYEVATGDLLTLRLDLPEAGLPVQASEDVVDQVMLNLAVNACDAVYGQDRRKQPGSAAASELRVTGDHTGGRVRLRVSDHGPGVPAELRSQVFEPFFSTKPGALGTGRADDRPTGLGLSTVYGLMQRVGGEVTLSDTPGGGATFTLLLPAGAAEAAGNAAAAVGATTDRATASAPAGRGGVRATGGGPERSVLLAEDNARLRKVLAATLEEAGFKVYARDGGPSALRFLEEHGDDAPPPGILVSDVAMPGMTGLELAEKVTERWPDLPVLLISGYTDGELPTPGGRPAERPAAWGFLQKPFESETLVRAIEQRIALRG